MTVINFRTTFECPECARHITKEHKFEQSSIHITECRECGERDVYYDAVEKHQLNGREQRKAAEKHNPDLETAQAQVEDRGDGPNE